MTGFGRAEQAVGDKTFQVDIKSLNGKQFELQLKLPAFLKPFEFSIRKLISEKLGRSSLDCTISLKGTGNSGSKVFEKVPTYATIPRSSMLCSESVGRPS